MHLSSITNRPHSWVGICSVFTVLGIFFLPSPIETFLSFQSLASLLPQRPSVPGLCAFDYCTAVSAVVHFKPTARQSWWCLLPPSLQPFASHSPATRSSTLRRGEKKHSCRFTELSERKTAREVHSVKMPGMRGTRRLNLSQKFDV